MVMNLGVCEDGEILNKIRVSKVFRQDYDPLLRSGVCQHLNAKNLFPSVIPHLLLKHIEFD